MRLLLISILIVLVQDNVRAQAFAGAVLDASSGEGIATVQIENLNTRNISYSDQVGHFAVIIHPGDTLAFSIVGYDRVLLPVSLAATKLYPYVRLIRKTVNIDTVVIRSLTKRQQDSLFNRQLYGKKVEQQQAKFKLARKDKLYGGARNGILNFDAPISSIIERFSRKYKKLRAF